MANKEEAGAGDSIPLGGAEIDRDALLSLLGHVLQGQHKKVLNGRIRDARSFKLRLDAVRVYAYVASVYGSILKDKDLSEIIKRLEILENNANKS